MTSNKPVKAAGKSLQKPLARNYRKFSANTSPGKSLRAFHEPKRVAYDEARKLNGAAARATGKGKVSRQPRASELFEIQFPN